MTYTLTDDFDADGIADSFEFTLLGTATGGNAVATTSYLGVNNPRIDANETLTYSISLPTTIAFSSGGTGSVSFDGFTGGMMNTQGATDYTVNGVEFATATFTAADTTTMTIGGPSDDSNPFVTGVSFGMTVISEPAMIGMLGLGAFVTLLVRRNQRGTFIKSLRCRLGAFV
jgi:hypothetical protein